MLQDSDEGGGLQQQVSASCSTATRLAEARSALCGAKTHETVVIIVAQRVREHFQHLVRRYRRLNRAAQCREFGQRKHAVTVDVELVERRA